MLGEIGLHEDLEKQIKEIYRAYYKDVYHFLLYFTGNQNDAEDLTQEVFIRLLNVLPRYNGGRASLKTWILTVAKNLAIDQHRKKKFRLLFAENWLKQQPSQQGLPEAVLAIKEDEQSVEKALRLIKPQYRMIIILRCIKGYSVKETAEILECSEAKVKVDYHRAIKLLQGKLGSSREGGWLSELVT